MSEPHGQKRPREEPAAPPQEDIDDMFARLEQEFLAEAKAKLGQGPPVPAVQEPPKKRVATEAEQAPPPAQPAKPAGQAPHAGKVKNLRGGFGDGYHDKAHFHATDQKSKHGVWGAKLGKVKQWVQLALDSIHASDDYVVRWKAGDKPGAVNYLVDMKENIGFISGSSVPPGQQPATTHMALFIDRQGNTVSAFPCDPDMF